MAEKITSTWINCVVDEISKEEIFVQHDWSSIKELVYRVCQEGGRKDEVEGYDVICQDLSYGVGQNPHESDVCTFPLGKGFGVGTRILGK